MIHDEIRLIMMHEEGRVWQILVKCPLMLHHLRKHRSLLRRWGVGVGSKAHRWLGIDIPSMSGVRPRIEDRQQYGVTGG